MTCLKQHVTTLVSSVLLAALSACGAVPAVKSTAQDSAVNSSPLASSSGMVIGTLSYQYVDLGPRRSPLSWVVHFERVDQQATKQDYALVVNVDPQTSSGVFTGALPAGVYAFRNAASADRRYIVGAMKMPFEVQAGAVQDAGHYALNPLTSH